MLHWIYIFNMAKLKSLLRKWLNNMKKKCSDINKKCFNMITKWKFTMPFKKFLFKLLHHQIWQLQLFKQSLHSQTPLHLQIDISKLLKALVQLCKTDMVTLSLISTKQLEPLISLIVIKEELLPSITFKLKTDQSWLLVLSLLFSSE